MNPIWHSIIIPSAGRPAAVKAAIKSVLAQAPSKLGAELIVIDNNVDDIFAKDLEAYCNELRNEIRYFRERSPGLSAARHRGAYEAQGDVLTFLDDDVEVSDTWLPAIQNAFSDSMVVMVGGPSIPKFNSSIPDWFWGFFSSTPYGGWMNPWLSLLDIGKNVEDFDPSYIWGLNFSIRKETMYKCGGFHTDLVPAAFQRWQGDGETGLGLKVKEYGFKARYVQDALVTHLCGHDRLNIDYFKRRAFYQGVSSSFTQIRAGKLCPVSSKNYTCIQLYNLLRSYGRQIFNTCRRKSVWDEQAREVRLITDKAELDGLEFHRNEVRNDPELLKWIKRTNYFDTDLREFKK